MTDKKIFVVEWDKQPTGQYDCKVTPHDSAAEALQQAKSSTSDQHCVSSENPLKNEGSEDEK